MEDSAEKQRIDTTLTATNIIAYCVVAVFLPYVLSAIVLGFLAIYVLLNSKTRQLIFIHKGSKLLKLFFVYSIFISFVYGNWMGVAVGIGMVLMLSLGLYLRSIMTRGRYEKALTMICTMSLTSSGYAVFEALIHYLTGEGFHHRISAVFSHPNYFGTIAATVIIICVYKVLTSKENKWFFYAVTLANIVSLYLCMSMFAFIEVFIGILVLLAVLKRRYLLMLWVTVAVVGAGLIFIVNVNLIPRLSDVEVTIRLRQQIWDLALVQIKKNPFFGHGLLSFRHLNHAMYQNRQIPHSHSIYLDTILNFGIVGTILFLGYFIRYYIDVITNVIRGKNVRRAALILAVTVASLVHGTTDLTLFWIQTSALFLILLAGQGDEKDTIII